MNAPDRSHARPAAKLLSGNAACAQGAIDAGCTFFAGYPITPSSEIAERLSVLVRLIGEEASQRRAGRDLVLTRLVEVLLIEALRAAPGEDAPPGLLRGLADVRVAAAIRQLHRQPARAWTMAQLAQAAALSRSAFFECFTRLVGVPPMAYLFGWRMAVAKDLLGRGELGLAEVAERVGYSSSSTFSTAFSRHVGQPPRRYAMAVRQAAPPLTVRSRRGR